MSAGKHIAGPWRVLNHSWCDTSILADGFDHAICCLDINHATEESQEADEALMAANARLIAAAPELLGAQTMGAELDTPCFLDWIADRLIDVYGESPVVDFVQSLRARATAGRAAIAKATGATP